MWRFIVVTFGFLGFAFYQLSGGANYVPKDGSRQHAAQRAQAIKTTALPGTQKATHNAPQVTTNPVIILRNPQTSGQDASGAGDARLVLASANPELATTNAGKRAELTLSGATEAITGANGAVPEVATVAADPDKIARLVAAAATNARVPAPPAEVVRSNVGLSADQEYRLVKAARVNMRSGPGTDYEVVDQLTQGTEVAILHDDGYGWVELRVLESGQEGWMADYLLVSAN